MKKVLAIALAMLMLLPALAFAEDGCEITARGNAVINVDPDMVSVTANAQVTADTVSQAQTQMSEIIKAVTESLLALGVQEEDIVTQDYSYYPSYNYEESTPRLVGYQANHSLFISCRDIGMLDAVISAITESGMNEIYNVQYNVSNRSELYQKALAMAIEVAGEKAQTMAEPLGMTQLTPKEVIENASYEYSVYENVAVDAARAEDASIETGIRSGTIAVNASVTVVYSAQP